MILAIVLATAAPQAAVCRQLEADYETASKRLALSFVEGMVSDSRARKMATEARDANVLAEAGQTLELLKAHRCALPTSTPKAGYYLTPAMDCYTARLTPGSAETRACDMETWQRMKTVPKP